MLGVAIIQRRDNPGRGDRNMRIFFHHLGDPGLYLLRNRVDVRLAVVRGEGEFSPADIQPDAVSAHENIPPISCRHGMGMRPHRFFYLYSSFYYSLFWSNKEAFLF